MQTNSSSRRGGSIERAGPILLVFAIIGYEYGAFTFIFLRHLFTINIASAVLVLIEFHILLGLLLWSYIKCISTPPGYLPININEQFSNVEEIKDQAKKYTQSRRPQIRPLNPEKQDANYVSRSNGLNNGYSKIDSHLTSEVQSSNPSIDIEAPTIHNTNNPNIKPDIIAHIQQISYCFKCDKIKVPRAHHCRQCNTCVLRMDHHCPWVGSCVGLYNHKFFILFLIYAAIILLNVTLLVGLCVILNLLPSLVDQLSLVEKTQLQINAMTSLALCLAVGFLGIFQINCAGKNITTVEHHISELHKKNPFSRGSFSENLAEIFGRDKSNWFLPVNPQILKGDDMFLAKTF